MPGPDTLPGSSLHLTLRVRPTSCSALPRHITTCHTISVVVVPQGALPSPQVGEGCERAGEPLQLRRPPGVGDRGQPGCYRCPLNSVPMIRPTAEPGSPVDSANPKPKRLPLDLSTRGVAGTYSHQMIRRPVERRPRGTAGSPLGMAHQRGLPRMQRCHLPLGPLCFESRTIRHRGVRTV